MSLVPPTDLVFMATINFPSICLAGMLSIDLYNNNNPILFFVIGLLNYDFYKIVRS
jgi:hypothetical protein